VNLTAQQFDTIIQNCYDVFKLKTKDYGTSWRLFRPSSLTDQLLIKAKRIKTIEQGAVAKVSDSIASEYEGIVNYSIIAMIQLQLSDHDPINMPAEQANDWYQKNINLVKELMLKKNHDYGEAWREMRVTSFTDMILTKLYRIKQIEDNAGVTLVSEGLDAHYMDIINYSIFALITINKS
jgi:hypothetical protein